MMFRTVWNYIDICTTRIVLWRIVPYEYMYVSYRTSGFVHCRSVPYNMHIPAALNCTQQYCIVHYYRVSYCVVQTCTMRYRTLKRRTLSPRTLKHCAV